eukprot:268248-Hanusia_phi.AAC.1
MVVYSPHAEFSKQSGPACCSCFLSEICSELKFKQAISRHHRGKACLCTFPWCSWLLPEECEISHFT